MLKTRWMVRRDHKQIGRILKSFGSPQTVADIRRKLSKNVAGMVAAEQGNVEGFMLYAFHPEESKLRVIDFAVACRDRWDEVAPELLRAMEKKLGKRYTHCEIDVALEWASFFAREGYYAVSEEDDLVRMQLWSDSRIPRFRRKREAAK